jgi:hypothetical protein
MPEMILEELAHKGEAALTEATRKLGEHLPVERDRVLKAVDEAFDAMEVFVKNQRAFAHTVVDSVFAQIAPLPAPAKPATRKPATRKAAARKTAARKRATT